MGKLRHPCLVLTAGHRGGSSLFPWSCGRSYGSREESFPEKVETCAESTSSIKTGDIPATCSCDEQCPMTRGLGTPRSGGVFREHSFARVCSK